MQTDRKILAMFGALLAAIVLAGCAATAPVQSSSDVTDRLAQDSQGR